MAAPKIIPYNVELRSVNPVRSFDRPKAYTNDLNSVEFQFKVLDMTSTELTTATAVTLVYMRDGSFFANPPTDVSRVGNVFSYLLKENEGNHAGVAQIQLVVTVDGMELASQLFDFEIINGLETKVAQEVMIYDWTMLTRDAQDYIDQFVSNEATRQQQFADAQTQRGTTFGESEAGRTTIFNASEAGRISTFNASEAGRTTVFNAAEEARATGYDADHSRAGTDHTTAVNDHTLAGTDHTTAANDHTLAGTDHTRAESDHTRADADSATVAGFNTRLTAEETATANNKISAVKGKTFADVDARFEDVEFDTTMMASGLIANGDFVNTGGWIPLNATISASNNELTVTPTSLNVEVGVYRSSPSVSGNLTYISAEIYPKYNNAMQVGFYNGNKLPTVPLSPNAWNRLSGRLIANAQAFVFYHNMASSYVLTDTFKLRNIMAIDLTAAFGKGYEPTAEQMDGILAKFPNSWFNGTANLFRANATLNKLMAVDARTEFEAKNAVTNGDFNNGTTGWTLVASTLSVTNGILKITNGGGSLASAFQDILVSGRKHYIRLKWRRVTSNISTLMIRDTSTVLYSVLPADTNFRTDSLIFTPATAQLRIGFQANVPASPEEIEVDDVIVIDLTAAFGAGKEPTLAEMDRLMARFPNSWFDGVKPIQTIETLYQEKANKVQEAWLTPTLTNGWVVDDGYTVGYYKDEFGNVKIKGRVKSGSLSVPILTLPLAYRPAQTMWFPCICGGVVLGNISINTSGAVTLWSGNNTYTTLDTINFRV